MIYHVNAGAAAGGDGSSARPFRTIQQAADLALPGDEVLVAPGVYREWVDPRNGGTAAKPVRYRSEVPLRAVITGAEPLTQWEHLGDGVWCAQVPNSLFSHRNPYTDLVRGDWFMGGYIAHLGDIYLNGRSFYEVLTREELRAPRPSPASWEPERSLYVWYTEQNEAGDATLLYGNFRDLDPRRENVEFSVRPHCFWPRQNGVNYITVSGFRICQAADQWAPPTAYQEGMIGPNWAKGWIIEDCEIFEAKCSGVSLGKYRQPENDNKWLLRKLKDGTQTERDCILQAWREGWRKENVGSHTVRRCNIHHCGQTGIVGHLGGVFSLIEDNHIHHINNKQNLAGAEIGGIKMHAAIDVVFRRNHIHHCTRGIWLDWQAQGTRVTGNLFHDNALPFPHLMNDSALEGYGEDLFIEVSHGPTLVDDNLFLSLRALRLATQGCAFVHNLIAGSISAVGRGVMNGSATLPSPRYTPYHVPHSTDVAGFMTILHGDMRFVNNIFLQQEVPPFLTRVMEKRKDDPWDEGNVISGLHVFDFCPTREEWLKEFEGYCGMGSPAKDRYYIPLPVTAEGNLYLNGARPWAKEADPVCRTADAPLALTEKPDGLYLSLAGLDLTGPSAGPVSTDTLGEAFEPEQRFEAPDGSPIRFDADYLSDPRPARPLPGPFAAWSGEPVRVLKTRQ
jgi:hypothetical protein